MQSVSLAGSVWPWWGQFDKMYFKTLAKCIFQFWKIHFMFFFSHKSAPLISFSWAGSVWACWGQTAESWRHYTTNQQQICTPQLSYHVSQNIYTNKHLYNLQHYTTNQQQICTPQLSYHLSQNINTHLNYFAIPYNLMKKSYNMHPFCGKRVTGFIKKTYVTGHPLDLGCRNKGYTVVSVMDARWTILLLETVCPHWYCLQSPQTSFLKAFSVDHPLTIFSGPITRGGWKNPRDEGVKSWIHQLLSVFSPSHNDEYSFELNVYDYFWIESIF